MNRKMMSLLLFATMVFFAEQVIAVDDVKQNLSTFQRFGRVSLDGTILEPTCTISAGSRDQVIPLSTLSIPTLAVEGQGPIEYFSLRLTDCTLIDVKGTPAKRLRFTTTFDGASRNGYFQLSGEARGVSLAIADRYGRVAVPGQPLPPADIDGNTMSLLYQARIIRNNDVPRAGNYQATLRFKLEYY